MPDRTVLDAMAVQLIAAMRDPMRTSSSGSGSKGESRKAEPVKPATVKPMRRAAAPEREVKVRRAVELAASPRAETRAQLRLEEGPHGELVYERREAV
jgi:hypothetical protein